MKVYVCDVCYGHTGIVRESDSFGGYDYVSSCCRSGLYYMPKAIHDFYKPEIDKILDGKHQFQMGWADRRRMEIIEDALEPYTNTEDYYDE